MNTGKSHDLLSPTEPSPQTDGSVPPTGAWAERKRSSGQTMVEFSLTLPILLLLLFGIVEFGRMFQSWVTVQNASREATRYAITGAYDEGKYDIDALVPCSPDVYAMTESFTTVNAADGAQHIVRRMNDGQGPATSESLYATWYGTNDCFPDDASLQDRRDILRLPSIYDAARRGASGVALSPSVIPNGTQAELNTFINSIWENPSTSLEDPAFFTVTVCSTRRRFILTR